MSDARAAGTRAHARARRAVRDARAMGLACHDQLDMSGRLVMDRLDLLIMTESLRMEVPMTDRTSCSRRNTTSKGRDLYVASCTASYSPRPFPLVKLRFSLDFGLR